MRRATQGCGGPTVLGTQNPSVPLLHPPDERLPLQVGPVAQYGCWGSSHHLHIPGSQKEKGGGSIHVPFTGKSLEVPDLTSTPLSLARTQSRGNGTRKGGFLVPSCLR